jgi:CHAT domain-containing protein
MLRSVSGRPLRRPALFLAALLTALAFSPAAQANPVARPTNAPGDPEFNLATFPPHIREPTPEERGRENQVVVETLNAADDVEQALPRWRAVIAQSAASWGPEHPMTAELLSRVAQRVLALGHDAEAVRDLRRAYAIKQRTLGRFHRNTMWTLSALAATAPATEGERHWLSFLALSTERLKAMREAAAKQFEGLAADAGAQGRAGEATGLRAQAAAMRTAVLEKIAPPRPDHKYQWPDNPVQTTEWQQPERRLPTSAETVQRATSLAQARAAAMAGEHKTAEDAWTQALTIDLATWGQNHAASATAYLGLAEALAAQGRDGDAERYFRHAVQSLARHMGGWDPATLDANDRLAAFLSRTKNFAAAETVRREQLKYRLGALHSRIATYAGNLSQFAANLDALGKGTEAESLLKRAVALRAALFGKDDPHGARLLLQLARNLEAQGRDADAAPLFEKAAALYPKSLVTDPLTHAQFIAARAFNRLTLGKGADVEQDLLGVLKTYQEKLGPDHPQTSEALGDLGYFYLKTGKHGQALPYMQKAATLRSARLGPNHPRTVQALHNLATVELWLKQNDAALAHARQALSGRAIIKETTGAAAPEPLQRGVAKRYAGTALTFARASWTVAKTTPASAAALKAEAFAAIQGVAVSAAADAMTRSAARRLAQARGAAALVEAWERALDRVENLNARVARSLGGGADGHRKRSELIRQLDQALNARKTAEDALAAKLPAYFDILRSRPIAAADLQASAKLLRDDEVLIVLNPGDATLPEGQRNGLIFAVTKQRLAWAEIKAGPEALAAEIETLHKQLTLGGQTTRPGEEPVIGYERRRAFKLFQNLFADAEIAATVASKPRWLLAPQGALVSLPYAALVMAEPQGGEEADADPAALRATKWLGLEKTLVLIPSVPMLRVQRAGLSRARAAEQKFFGLGDPAFRGVPDLAPAAGDPDAKRMARRGPKAGKLFFRNGIGDPARIAELDRLPATNVEIRALAEFFKAPPSDYVLQMQASESELRRRDRDRSLAAADVITIATHGLIAGALDDTLAEPALALTPPASARGAKPNAANDGLLTASEAAALTLKARWVILSACNTAAGSKADSESLTGLARAFLLAGAQSLLVSHYPVLDGSAQKLTTAAVAEARKGMRHPEALRVAMRKLFDDPARDAIGASTAHPTAWAPFAIIDAD